MVFVVIKNLKNGNITYYIDKYARMYSFLNSTLGLLIDL